MPTEFHPLPSGSILEPTVPLGLHSPKTPKCVAILGNILGTGTGKALLAS